MEDKKEWNIKESFITTGYEDKTFMNYFTFLFLFTFFSTLPSVIILFGNFFPGVLIFLFPYIVSIAIFQSAITFHQYKNKSFYFNDEKKEIVFKSGKVLPYKIIKKISIFDKGRNLMLTFIIKSILYSPLKIFFTKDREEVVLKEFSSRFPDVKVRNRKFIEYIGISFSIILFLGFHIWFVEEMPVVKKIPERINISIPENISDEQIYEKDGFIFSFPSDYKLDKEKDLFKTPEGNLILIEESFVSFLKESIEGISKGIRYFAYSDGYNLMKKILYSKFGLVPLGIKFAFLSSYGDKNIKIFHFNSKNFNGFVISGDRISKSKGYVKVYTIFLHGKEKKKSIEMVIAGEKVDFKYIVKCLSFVKEVI